MIVKDYKPIGHIDFIDGTRVPVVKEFETKNTSTREVVNFVAVDGEMYQFDKNKNKHDPSNCICRFLKFNDKQCYFEPTDTIKEIEIYSAIGSRIYNTLGKFGQVNNRIDYSRWVRTSPEPAPIWPGDHSTMWVPNIKYENLKKDYTILANALKKLQEHSTFVTYTKMMQDSDGDRIPTRHTNYLLHGRGIDDQDTVHLLKEAFNIAEKDDTPEHTLRKMCYNIYNYNVLQKKYDALLKENEKLKDELTVTNDANYVINKNIADLKQQYKTLREKHDAVRKERYDLLQFKNKNWWIAEYAEQCPGSVSLIEANNKLKKANEELQRHYNAVSGENEELKKEVSALQQENSTLVVSRNLYKSSKGMLEFSLRGQIAGLSIANGRLEAELAIARDTNNTIKEKCVELEKENKNLKQEITDLKLTDVNYFRLETEKMLNEAQKLKIKRYAEALNIIDSNLGWTSRRDKDGEPYYYASSLILAKDINKIKQTLQEARHENN